MIRAPRVAAWPDIVLYAGSAAADPATVGGKLTYDGKVYALSHVFVWQPPFQELRLCLSDRPLPQPAATAPDSEELEDLETKLGGFSI